MHDDEFRGQGGCYVVNPQTGKRELIERTQDPTAGAAGPAAVTAQAAAELATIATAGSSVQPKGDA
jgi:hypothetical protein